MKEKFIEYCPVISFAGPCFKLYFIVYFKIIIACNNSDTSRTYHLKINSISNAEGGGHWEAFGDDPGETLLVLALHGAEALPEGGVLAGAVERLATSIRSLTSGEYAVRIGGQVYGGIGGRQHGGRVERGRPYLVGEVRPELFVPDVAGRIEPRRIGSIAKKPDDWRCAVPDICATSVTREQQPQAGYGD